VGGGRIKREDAKGAKVREEGSVIFGGAARPAALWGAVGRGAKGKDGAEDGGRTKREDAEGAKG
jgi:hypothetical protein